VFYFLRLQFFNPSSLCLKLSTDFGTASEAYFFLFTGFIQGLILTSLRRDFKGAGMDSVNWFSDQEFLDSEIKDLQLITVYLLSTGRNAWHSTWSEKYRPDTALFATFENAKTAAEKARNRGTKFEIEQYPGLAFFSTVGVIVLVEFHSKEPFARLKFEEIEKKLKLGTAISAAIDPFVMATDEFWNRPFPAGSSFVSARSSLAESFEPLPPHNYLKKWGSRAVGSTYYLGWDEKNKPVVNPIWRILETFTENNSDLDIKSAIDELETFRQSAVDEHRAQLERDAVLENVNLFFQRLKAHNDSMRNDEKQE